MRATRLGLITLPGPRPDWACRGMLQPTPVRIGADRIRILAGFRDGDGRARPGYVDIDPAQPARALGVAARPCLELGRPGAFDDNGIVPTCVMRTPDGQMAMYYAGYQLPNKVRFMAFCGCATSENDGERFKRVSEVPVMDRSDEGLLFRVIHSALPQADGVRVWYGAGSAFLEGEHKSLPSYDIRTLVSSTPYRFPLSGTTCLRPERDEYRVGRPYVLRDRRGYHMFFGAGSQRVPYRLAYAFSPDGEHWTRDDDALTFTGAPEPGVDDLMAAYPAVVPLDDGGREHLLFYNGNDYGAAGICVARLDGGLGSPA